MDPAAKSRWQTVAMVAGSILASVALHGKNAIDALGEVPLMFAKWAEHLPFGFWSFLLSLAVGTLVWFPLVKHRPPLPCGKSRSFGNDSTIVSLTVFVTLSQQWAMPGYSREALVNAIWLGVVAGLLASWVARGLRSLFAPVAKEIAK